jgi:hypothetical protein
VKKSVNTDKSGRLIQPGDLIVYGHALGRCAGLQYGKVLAVNWKDERVYDYRTNKWDEDARVPHFTVQGVDQDWSHEEPKLLKRKGTLQFGDRILVVEREQVPMTVLELLDSVSL